MIRALDSAGAITPSAALAARVAGYRYWMRYVAGRFAMTRAELLAAAAAGIQVISIWEIAADAALGGGPAGRADALEALSAMRALGQPIGSLVIFTVDFDPTVLQLPAVFEYLEAATAVVRKAGYRGGAYGGAHVVAGMAGKCDFRMQAAGWSYGVTVPGCGAYQQLRTVTIGGLVECDVDLLPLAPTVPLGWTAKGLEVVAPPKRRFVTRAITKALPTARYDPRTHSLAEWDLVWTRYHKEAA